MSASPLLRLGNFSSIPSAHVHEEEAKEGAKGEEEEQWSTTI